MDLLSLSVCVQVRAGRPIKQQIARYCEKMSKKSIEHFSGFCVELLNEIKFTGVIKIGDRAFCIAL